MSLWRRSSFLLLLSSAALLASACQNGVGPLRTDEQRVELGAAEVVTAEINIGAGELTIAEGEGPLLEATFNYNVEEWQPEVAYEVSDGEGNLIVGQPRIDSQASLSIDPANVRNEWDLRFDGAIRLNLAISMGAGEGTLELGDLTLERLRFRGGAGQVKIDLRGSSANDLDVTMGAGEVELDLSGDWSQDLEGAIEGGIGRLTVRLPSTVGVRVVATGGLGNVTAAGLKQDGDSYTNDAYGQSGTTLDLNIEAGIGDINLEVVE